jgi:hypothetical protein
LVSIILLCCWNLIGLYTIYRNFKKKRMLFDDHFTMTMCMVTTMITSFVFGLYLALLLPAFQMVPVLLGLWIGWKFGSILKNPATLNGLYNGTMGGVMGTMLGAVLQNPALCNIPVESEAMIATNMYSITLFVACLHTFIMILIHYSFRV